MFMHVAEFIKREIIHNEEVLQFTELNVWGFSLISNIGKKENNILDIGQQ